MIAQLIAQKLSPTEAKKKVEEIERKQTFNYLKASLQRKETVGSYFKKHKAKCQRKFKNQ